MNQVRINKKPFPSTSPIFQVNPHCTQSKKGGGTPKVIDLKMQACGSVCFTATLPLKSSKALSLLRSTPSSSKPRTKRPSLAITKAAAGSPADAAAVENVIDYSSSASVFPAEACETIGGEACIDTIFPETKLEASTSSSDSNIAVEEIDREYLDYNQPKTVFPAEACETIGGEACSDTIFPETKLEASTSSSDSNIAVEEIDREYLDYNQPKTVFPGEACDDLGGEFCAPEYQIGVCQDRALT